MTNNPKHDDKDYVSGEIKFKFDPEHPKHAQQIRNLLSSTKWYLALWDLDQKLRSAIKHGHQQPNGKNWSGAQEDAAQQIREWLWEAMEENGVSFDDFE
jgi:hypothetical protein